MAAQCEMRLRASLTQGDLMKPFTGIVAGGAMLACIASNAAPGTEPAGVGLGIEAASGALGLRDNIYMITTPDGNVTVQTGTEGLVVVGAPAAVFRAGTQAAVAKLNGGPVRFIIDTSADPGGGSAVDQMAFKREGDDPLYQQIGISQSTMRVIGHQNVLMRMSDAQRGGAELPAASVPTDAYVSPDIHIYFNGGPLEVIHLPAAHTDGDSAVVFRRSDVLSAGDVLDMTRYPRIDRSRGGSVAGLVEALNRLLAIAVPDPTDENGTLIVPGNGRLCDAADVAEYRDMIVIIQDRIRDLVKQRRTLEQVYAAHPTLDYDGIYGRDEGPWTTRMFIAAIYADLKS